MSMDNPGRIRLTPNFTLGEFLRTDDPVPPPWVLDNLYRLANRLQVVRDVLGKPITVTSGYRTAEHNRSVGGFPKSFHMNGMAADIVVDGMTAADVQVFLKNWHGGLGAYKTFTHLDIRSYRARWKG